MYHSINVYVWIWAVLDYYFVFGQNERNGKRQEIIEFTSNPSSSWTDLRAMSKHCEKDETQRDGKEQLH